MLGLDKFLELFKDSKFTTPLLVALLIVGSVGGAIWINVLNARVDNYKEALETSKTSALAQNEANNSLSNTKITRIQYKLEDFAYDVDRTTRVMVSNKKDFYALVGFLIEYF